MLGSQVVYIYQCYNLQYQVHYTSSNYSEFTSEVENSNELQKKSQVY